MGLEALQVDERLGQVDDVGVRGVEVGQVVVVLGGAAVGARLAHHLPVSTPGPSSVGPSVVPENPDAYCFTTTGSPGDGASTSRPRSPGASSANAAGAGTLRTNSPPSARPGA